MLTYLYLLIKNSSNKTDFYSLIKYSSNKTEFYSGTRFCPLKNKNVNSHSYLLENY